MKADEILKEIGDFCRESGMAESTFGRLVVNDGKLTSRLRGGGRITDETLGRVRGFMAEHRAGRTAEAGAPATNAAKSAKSAKSVKSDDGRRPTRGSAARKSPADRTSPKDIARDSGKDAGKNAAATAATIDQDTESSRDFRFFDNRQKYLMFVNTCSEKWVVANRIAMELDNIHPRPPALRLFDAGVGDGTVLTRVMRTMHARFPTVPFYIAGKEISLEDVRLTLEKMADRFFEHPATILVLTNLYYSEAPWLAPKSTSAAQSMIWKEVALTGSESANFEEQITNLQPFLADAWKAGHSPKSGNPIYERPVVLILYREDHKFLLDNVIPRPGRVTADYDMVIASQPYRARTSAAFKAKRVVAPLARAVGPGGRLIGIHSCGGDPGLEVVQKIWPGDEPFATDRHELLKAVKQELGSDARGLNFNAYSDARSVFRYDMHTLPGEVSGAIGTSTLFAAWNAAVYVAQVEDARIEKAVQDAGAGYLDATDEVLKKHGGLWFNDETYVISRRRV